jgi:hypothetical protein
MECRLSEQGPVKQKTAMSLLRWFCVGAALAMGAMASAQDVYKCRSSSGKITYADEPCAKSDSASRVSVQPNLLVAFQPRDTPLRPDAEPLHARHLSAPAQAPLAAATPMADATPARLDSPACERAKRDYEVTASSSANTRAIIAAKRSMMFSACGQREPDISQTVIIRHAAHPPLGGGAYAILP